jgi:hypothetical protein
MLSADYLVDLGSPELTALTSALTSLAEASDAVTAAVQLHDRVALEHANLRAEHLVGEVNSRAAALTPRDRAVIASTGIAGVCERLAVSGRRNAYLIEQAWAVDAALMRLLVGIGKSGPDGAAGAYGEPPTPTYVDRQA